MRTVLGWSALWALVTSVSTNFLLTLGVGVYTDEAARAVSAASLVGAGAGAVVGAAGAWVRSRWRWRWAGLLLGLTVGAAALGLSFAIDRSIHPGLHVEKTPGPSPGGPIVRQRSHLESAGEGASSGALLGLLVGAFAAWRATSPER
jgi:hypothetical protein